MRNLTDEELDKIYEVFKNLTYGEKKEIEKNTGVSFKKNKTLILEKNGLFPGLK